MPAGVIVLDAIMSPLAVEVKQGKNALAASAIGSDEGSPVVGPPRAIEGLVSLVGPSKPHCPAEVKANVCTLFSQLGRKGSRTYKEREAEVKKLKEAAKDVVVKISQGDDMLGKAAKKVLEAWESG